MAHSTRVLPFLTLATLPLLAAKVVVEPKGQQFHAGSTFQGAASGLETKAGPGFRFHATLEGAAEAPAWDWSVVDVDGKTALADAGHISQDGVYTPPAVALSKFRLIRIKATARSAGHPSGTVLVTLRPHLALTALEKTLGRQWRGERVEVLADLTPFEERAGTVEFKHPGDLPMVAFEDDRESDLGLKDPFLAAYAGRVPWVQGEDAGGQWLVAAHEHLYLVSGKGKVRPVPVDATGILRDGGRSYRYRPLFTQVVVQSRPGGSDDDWRCFLWDACGTRIWRLDAAGRLKEFRNLSGEVDFCLGLALDRQGAIYLNGVFLGLSLGDRGAFELVDDGDGHDWARSEGFEPSACEETPTQAVYRIDSQGGMTLLAGGRQTDQPVDGKGGEAGFVHARGLALDPDHHRAYLVDTDQYDQAWVRTLDLERNRITSRPLEHRRFREADGPSWPVHHRGTLLVSRSRPPALFVVDPKSGHCEQVYRDAIPPRPRAAGGADGDAPSPGRGIVPGPCFHKAPGLSRATCASLGMGFKGTFAIGDDGQILTMAEGTPRQLGLLLLDWGDPRSPLGRAARAGTAAGVGAGKPKGPVAPGAGDGKAGGGTGAGREEQKQPAPSMAGEQPKDGGAGPATRPPAGPPRIEGFQPSYGAPGTRVVVVGQNLDTVDEVAIGTLRIPVFHASPAGTSLSFTVPAGAPVTQAPILVSRPDGTGGRRQRAMSLDFFSVLPAPPAAKP